MAQSTRDSLPGGTKHELVEDASYSSSGDINPIERVWAELKRYIARRVKSLSKCELIGGIVLFWSRWMTQDKRVKYIRDVNQVLPKVVAKKEAITGE